MSPSNNKRPVWGVVVRDRFCLPGILVLRRTLQNHGSVYPLVAILSRETQDLPDVERVLAVAGIKSVQSFGANPNNIHIRHPVYLYKVAAWGVLHPEISIIGLLDSDQQVFANIDNLMAEKRVGADEIASIDLFVTHPNTIILRPSADKYELIQATLALIWMTGPTAFLNILQIYFRDKNRGMRTEYDTLESELSASRRYKVLKYNIARPWVEREWGNRPSAWWNVWTSLEREWSTGGRVKARLWEAFLGPLTSFDNPS